ncbi:hypothetical protein DFR74_103371 [Nocardia puris]|uniref:DUF6542 domain-containing protein n=1 Tax=Nocardia puris TaxID=208602 RepID=A0A366DRK5_9NOCA|nr:hypothetical protein DFR74_103371 [Nocardia puris]
MPAPQRSILPTVPGVPAWSAVLIAVACTLLGFLIDAHGDQTDLTGSFAALYVIGCVAAVLAVRYRGIFTTLVLPPLLLFLAVPLAYQQLTGSSSTGIKDILFNLAIPLVNRFPTMMLATALVLAIGAARILLHRREAAAEKSTQARRGTSWGRSAMAKREDKRSMKRAEKRPEPRVAKKEAPQAKRRPRRPQPEIDDPVTDKYEPPRPGRRPPRDVADAPPRVGARGREGRPPARGGRPAAVPRGEAEPARGARGRAEAPPHPQPNVRYRDREPGRPQRRKPESL